MRPGLSERGEGGHEALLVEAAEGLELGCCGKALLIVTLGEGKELRKLAGEGVRRTMTCMLDHTTREHRKRTLGLVTYTTLRAGLTKHDESLGKEQC